MRPKTSRSTSCRRSVKYSCVSSSATCLVWSTQPSRVMLIAKIMFLILSVLTPAQPEGLQERSRWSESAETTGRVVNHDRTPKGCQTSQQVLLVKFDTGLVKKLSQF